MNIAQHDRFSFKTREAAAHRRTREHPEKSKPPLNHCLYALEILKENHSSANLLIAQCVYDLTLN
jgi:hypothetical protein